MALERREIREARARTKRRSAVVASEGPAHGWRDRKRAREGSRSSDESLWDGGACQCRPPKDIHGGVGYVRFYKGYRLRVEGVRLEEGRWRETAEQAGSGDSLDQRQPAHLAQVAAADEVLEGLEVGPRVALVQGLVPPRHRQDALAEHAQLGVDDHVAGPFEPARGPAAELVAPDARHRQVDGDVHPGAEDQAEARRGVGVGPGEERRRGVVHDGGELDVDASASARGLDDVSEILSQEPVGGEEALAHALQFTAFE